MSMLEAFVTILVSVLASSGVWAVVMKIMDKKDVRTQMLIGLGHDRIMYLGNTYIARGYITSEEYENLVDYLYRPYELMGGNGSAKRVIEEVKKLPLNKPDKE